MKLKQVASLLLAGTFALCAGCAPAAPAASKAPAGGADAPKTSAAAPDTKIDPKNVKIGILIPGSPTDGGFSQQAAEAGKKLQETYGYEVNVVEAATAETIKSEGEAMANEGYQIVFGHGGQCSSPLAEICEDYPETWFVSFGGTEIRDNLFPVCMCAEEGTYVLGVAAGMMTKTNKIAYTLGGDYPAYTKTNRGLALGAKSVNPAIEVMSAVLASPDANECYEQTMNQIRSGADVILSNTNEGQTGAMKAVTESKDTYIVGCLGDFFNQAPGKVIGNVIGDYSIGYDQATQAILNGSAKAEIMYLTIASGAVQVQWNPDLKDVIPADAMKAAEQAYEDIKSGKIHVPNEYEQDKAIEMLEAK